MCTSASHLPLLEDQDKIWPPDLQGDLPESCLSSIATQPRGEDHVWARGLCWLLGLTYLLPWNCILTIEDYYYAVFPKYHPSRVFTMIYEPLALTTALIFTFYEARVSTRRRVLLGYGGYTVFLLLLIIEDVATAGHGGVVPYVGVCVLIAGLAISDGTAQGALVGELCFMDPTYIQAYSAGLAMSGVATSVLRMITKAAFGDFHSGIRKGALTFFAIAVFAETAGFLLYGTVFPNLLAVKRFRRTAQQQGALTVRDNLAAAGLRADQDQDEAGKRVHRLTVWQLAARIWDYLLDMVVIFSVSLCIFPGFLYENTGNHKLGAWYPLLLIAMFNVGDFVGRYMPLLKPFSLVSRKGLFRLCLSRVLFIPCFYFAAKYADAGWMIFLCFLLGWTNGYLTSLGMMLAAQGYSSPEQNAIGNLLVLAIVVGLTLGVTSGWLWLIGHGW